MNSRLIKYFLLLLINFTYSCNAQDEFVYIFAHGLGGNCDQVRYYQYYGIINPKCKVFSKDGPEVSMGYNFSTLGQEEDINVIINEIEQAYKENPSCKIIGVGVSKGAATWINTLGKLADEKPEYLKNINAVIIESSFAQVQDVVLNFLPKPLSSIIPYRSVNPILKWKFPKFDKNGPQPIKSIQKQWNNLNKDMVIVFIHSKKDKLIPYKDSEKMFSEVKKLGFKNSYFITAEKGDHANLFWGPDYKNVFTELYNIYNKHNLY